MLFPVLITLAYIAIAIALFTAIAALLGCTDLDSPRESSQQPQEPADEEDFDLKVAA